MISGNLRRSVGMLKRITATLTSPAIMPAK